MKKQIILSASLALFLAVASLSLRPLIPNLSSPSNSAAVVLSSSQRQSLIVQIQKEIASLIAQLILQLKSQGLSTATSILLTVGKAVSTPMSGGGGGGGGYSAPVSVPVVTPPSVPYTILSGNVTDTNSNPITGGTVQVLTGSTVVASAGISNGSYSLSSSSLSPGTYTLELEPSLAYSLGPSEPDTRSITLAANTQTTQGFVVQGAVYATDFQSFTSTNDLTRGQMTTNCSTGVPIPAGGFFYNPALSAVLGCTYPAYISLDPTGGPNATKAMEYSFPSNPPVSPPSCPNTDFGISMSPQFSHSIPTSGSFWIRWTDKLSSGFRIGSDTSAGCNHEYKYLLLGFGPGPGRLGLYIDEDPNASTLQALTVLIDTDGNQTAAYTGGDPARTIGTVASFTGQYHTWLIHAYNLGTAATVFEVYLDGALIQRQIGPFYPLQTPADASEFWNVGMGANMNTGPDNAEQRWFRELGLYYTRPSMVNLAQ